MARLTPCFLDRQGLSIEQLKAKTIDEAKKRAKPVKAAAAKKVVPKNSADKAAAEIKAKAQMPYESSAPVGTGIH